MSIPLISPEIFWGEIPACDHLVQIYDKDEVFLDSLEGFACGGLQSGEAVVVIATPAHLDALKERLKTRGIDLNAARNDDQFIDLDAEKTLSKFTVAGWPDARRFEQLVTDLLVRAKGAHGRRVRAFGEMVAVLWAQGHNGATVQLEHLWRKLCQEHEFSLFCAYPRIGLTQGPAESMKEICSAHSRVIYA